MSGLAPGEPSDATLLKQHADGDPDAFGLLFKRHKERLWAVALRIACDPDDAADALQEAMISAFRRAADFRGEAGTTAVFPNTDQYKPVVALYTGMLGVQWRGPKNQRAAINYHAFGGASHGDFNINARTDEFIGLYTNRTKPFAAVGASVDFNRSKNIAIRVSPDLILEHYGSEWREFFSVSGGVIYRFGKR